MASRLATLLTSATVRLTGRTLESADGWLEAHRLCLYQHFVMKHVQEVQNDAYVDNRLLLVPKDARLAITRDQTSRRLAACIHKAARLILT